MRTLLSAVAAATMGLISTVASRPELSVEARPADHAGCALGGRRLDGSDGPHCGDGNRIGARSEVRRRNQPGASGSVGTKDVARRRQGRLHLGRRRGRRCRRLQGARPPRQRLKDWNLFLAVANVNAHRRQPERAVQGLWAVARHAEEERQERSGGDGGALLGRPQHDGDGQEGRAGVEYPTSPTMAAIRRCCRPFPARPRPSPSFSSRCPR